MLKNFSQKHFIKSITFLFVLVMFIPFLSVFVSADTDDTPRVTELYGTVKVMRSGGLLEYTMYKGMAIEAGDTIITDINSSVTLFFDKKEVVVGSCSTVYINDVLSKHGRDICQITVIEGSVKNKIDKHLDDSSKNVIKTANAIAGVRGTEFIMSYSRNIPTEKLNGENPFTAIVTLNSTVRFDIVKNEKQQEGQLEFLSKSYESYFVKNDGVEKLGDTESSDPVKVTKNFEMKAEDIDVKILEIVAKDPKIISENPGFFENINEILEKKQEEVEKQLKTLQENAEAPQYFVIYSSVANEVIPTLPETDGNLEIPVLKPVELVSQEDFNNAPADDITTTSPATTTAPESTTVNTTTNTPAITTATASTTPSSTATTAAAPRNSATTAATPRNSATTTKASESIITTTKITTKDSTASSPIIITTPSTITTTSATGTLTKTSTVSETGMNSSTTTDITTNDTSTVPAPIDISSATINVSETYVYTGTLIIPTYTVEVDGITLTKDTDFTVVYYDNLNAGTATIIITGKGYYTGTAVAYFTIEILH